MLVTKVLPKQSSPVSVRFYFYFRASSIHPATSCVPSLLKEAVVGEATSIKEVPLEKQQRGLLIGLDRVCRQVCSLVKTGCVERPAHLFRQDA